MSTEEAFSTRHFQSFGIERALSSAKSRDYSGHTTPSEKLENFTERHLKELFDDSKIHEGILMVGFVAKKGYGTELREKWVDNIIIAQSQKDMLNMYVAKLEEIKRLGVGTFLSPKRMLCVNVYWIKADGKPVLLFENNEWLRRDSVLEIFDGVAKLKGYKPVDIPLTLKKVTLTLENSSKVIVNLWQKPYLNSNGETRNLICQIEAGALFDVADEMFEINKEYKLVSKQEIIASRFMQFMICENMLCKCGD